MKALYLNAPFKLELVDVPMPEIKAPNEVLVKVMFAGICGSDMHNYLGESSGITYPLVAGHEMAAEVVETGSEASDLRVGDHVVMDPVVSCGHCYPCSIGRGNICENIKSRGSHCDGCMQEYMVLKRGTIHKISSGIPWERAVLVEPFTIAGQCTSRAAVTAGDTVYIAGGGPIGLCIMLMCKLLGAQVIIADVLESRLEFAKKLGADYAVNLTKQKPAEAIKNCGDIRGVTVAIDAAGNPTVIAELVNFILPTGRIISLGFHSQPCPIPLVAVTKKELAILGSRMSVNQFDRVIKLFEENKIDGSPLISGIFDFEHSADAFNEAINNKASNIKTLIRVNNYRR